MTEAPGRRTWCGDEAAVRCLPSHPGRPGGAWSLAGIAVALPALQAVQDPPETLPEPPLPGGVAAVIRWFMHVPQPIQIGGAILGFGLAVALAVLLWRKRREIAGWLGTRSRGIQAGLAAAVGTIVIVVAAFGYRAYDYVEHDNAFCSACHVMAPAFQRFQHSEHADLLCHDCHQQPLSASARQLYLWVMDRPEDIGPHAPVPDAVCVNCHVVEDASERWEQIAATAGHRLHLESDDPAVRDILCVTCHGQQVHEFVPADVTCGQAGCHEPAETRIVLGRMTEEAGLHCVACHEFTALVAEDPVDPAFPGLRPGESQCFGCHDMRALLADFEPSLDPHDAACSICHNPHTQEVPALAFTTCTGAGCHERPAEESPFHRGVHEAVLRDCGACHQAHEWTVVGRECTDCHPAGGVRPPRAGGAGDRSEARAPRDVPPWHPQVVVDPRVPAEVAATPYWHPRVGPDQNWRPRVGPDEGWHPRVASYSARRLDEAGGGEVLPPRAIPREARDRQPFDHETHREIACTVCHVSDRRHGEIVIGAADCFSCHHTSPVVDAGCASCHAEAELAGARSLERPLQLQVWDAPRSRRLPFDHAVHSEVACGECHVGRSLAPERACSACHAEHHRAEASCLACHHEPPPDAHSLAVHLEGCAGAGCHEPAPVRYGELEKTRSFCLSCHREQVDHEPGERCARCHLVPA